MYERIPKENTSTNKNIFRIDKNVYLCTYEQQWKGFYWHNDVCSFILICNLRVNVVAMTLRKTEHWEYGSKR